MSALRTFTATVALGVLIVAVAIAAGIAFNDQPGGRETTAGYGVASDDPAQGRAYPGDPEREPTIVAAERGRLDLVRRAAATAPSRMTWLDGPYRVPTTPAPTLVLPPRDAPYTLPELATISPASVTVADDGSARVDENIVALAGAGLDLSTPGGVVSLVSAPDRFISIITLGGAFIAVGSADAPVTITSFDPANGAPDTVTSDGRAYIRVVGGTVDLNGASFQNLGFWSGETGGLALTGTEALSPGEPAGSEDEASGTPLLSAEDLAALTVGATPPGAVSGTVADVGLTGNAFGLFVSRATKLAMTGLRVQDSLVDGIVLNRSVTETTIESSASTGNAVDGLVIERSCSGIALKNVTASTNGRNGVSIDARALALGPSASGSPAVESGEIRVQDGTVGNNAGYGIRIDGGDDIALVDSKFSGNVVGIALAHGSSRVNIAANRFDGQSRQAIAVRGGVESTIHDNRIESVDTGIRVENATAVIENNEFTGITNHAVTLAGTATGVRVTGNTVAGDGSAPFLDAAAGGYFARNDADQWEQRVTPTSVVRAIAQPLTIVWTALGALLLLTIVAGFRQYRGRANREAERRPLTELTAGIVSVDELRGSTR
ncbi:right-handed parallel beta-helix repeat-containing protein [Agromyces sp. NPDC058126]|uniref:right-handed parallel beta-helix repeat-containing protein n=1 Tax=Agromyces sp. NPDC058126 TaxID=3346350 RepID=UPI0036DCDF61